MQDDEWTAPSLCGVEPEPVDVPLWREPAAVLDWLRLRVSSLCARRTTPVGDGSPVLVIPGFLCSDFHLSELRRWLERSGFAPHASGIRLNAGCLDTLGQSVVRRVEEIHGETGRRVHLVGHSLGGMLARSVAALSPASVASVVALGSPFRRLRSHALVLSAGRGLAKVYSIMPGATPGCLTPSCSCRIVCSADSYPGDVPFTAIYTRDDGVVDWRACRTGDPERDVEVSGTHLGLMYNPDAYRAIVAHLLRTAERTPAAA